MYFFLILTKAAETYRYTGSGRPSVRQKNGHNSASFLANALYLIPLKREQNSESDNDNGL